MTGWKGKSTLLQSRRALPFSSADRPRMDRKSGPFRFLRDAGRMDVLVEVAIEIVVRRHRVANCYQAVAEEDSTKNLPYLEIFF